VITVSRWPWRWRGRRPSPRLASRTDVCLSVGQV